MNPRDVHFLKISNLNLSFASITFKLFIFFMVFIINHKSYQVFIWLHNKKDTNYVFNNIFFFYIMSKLSLILCLSLIISVYSYGSGASLTMNQGIRFYFQNMIRQSLLDAHNNLRQKVASGNELGQPAATNMGAMSWDLELEQWASHWACTCPSNHRSTVTKASNKLDGSYFGENLYWSWTSS